jgi:hypothetical protein
LAEPVVVPEMRHVTLLHLFSIVTNNPKIFSPSNFIVILHPIVMEHPQAVIDYCESRFRAMMNEIEGADDEKANWVLRGINFELVSSKSRIVYQMLMELIGLISALHWSCSCNWDVD